jgi:hypothetical protein
MAARLSLHRALVTFVACGAVACGLSVSGLEDEATKGGGGSHPGSGGGPVTTMDSGAPGPSADGSTTGTVTFDATSPDDAAPSDDAPTEDVHVLDPDASFEGGDPCDLDEDGFRATGECGGDDCCDFDGRAHPGETSYFETTDACGSFDFDCNGKDDPQYTGVASCALGFFQCNGEGFDKTPPACGQSATYDACQYDLFFCSNGPTSKVQPCR